jgi:hypothetical protein
MAMTLKRKKLTVCLGVPEVAVQIAESEFSAVSPKTESISSLDINLMDM